MGGWGGTHETRDCGCPKHCDRGTLGLGHSGEKGEVSARSGIGKPPPYVPRWPCDREAKRKFLHGWSLKPHGALAPEIYGCIQKVRETLMRYWQGFGSYTWGPNFGCHFESFTLRDGD